MKQFTFPIAPAPHTSSPSSTGAAPSPSSRPPSAQRPRATTPIRPSLSHTSFPTRPPTASTPHAASNPAALSTPSLASELDGVNARVDRKFAYWKSYWSTVQQHAAATAAETVEQLQAEEKQQTSAAAAAGARSREQLEEVIRRMRERREEEMATSKLNTPRDADVSDKAKTAGSAGDKRAEMHEKRWDASPRLHKSEAERKRVDRRPTSDQDKKASAEQSPKSAADLRTERARSLHKSSATPSPSASPTPSAAPSHTASPSPSASTSSNLHRFWQDELHRHPHSHHSPHQPSYSTAQRTRRRKMEHLTLPADPEQARRLWEKMKLEMWQQWEEYQRNEDVRRGDSRGATAGRKVRVEEEKEPADPPQGSPLSASSFGSSFSSSSPDFSPLPRASSHYVPPSSSSARPPSGRRSTEPAGPLWGGLSGWSIRELRAELLRLNLTTHDCIEKSDMVNKLASYHQQQQQQQHVHTPQPPQQPQSPPAIDADHIIADVKRWSLNKSIIQLLNDLNTNQPNTTTNNTLQHDSSIEEVSRVYKKTLLRVHPDKCGMLDEEKRVRATEVFKVIHDKFVQFRDRNDKRGSIVL